MANPSNKKTGKSYLRTFNKDELISKSIDQAENVVELTNEIQKLKNENLALIKERDSLKRQLNRVNTQEYVVKKILELRAKNYTPSTIKTKLELMNIEKTLREIKDILNEELSPDLELFFAEKRQEYIESIRINTSLYQQSSIDEIQRLLDSAYEDLDNTDEEDLKLRSLLRDSIAGYISKRDNLIKTIVENDMEQSEEDKMAAEQVQQWERDSEAAIINIFDIMKKEKVMNK